MRANMRTLAESKLSPMEIFVRRVLEQYPSYLAEKRTYDHWLSIRENKEARDAMVLVDMKIAIVESWFELLNSDERFVIEQHILQNLEWPRVAFSFSERWKGEFTRAERTLVAYQASGLSKIVRFCEAHLNMVATLFPNEYEYKISCENEEK